MNRIVAKELVRIAKELVSWDQKMYVLEKELEELIRDYFPGTRKVEEFANKVGDTVTLKKLAEAALSYGAMRGKHRQGAAISKILLAVASRIAKRSGEGDGE